MTAVGKSGGISVGGARAGYDAPPSSPGFGYGLALADDPAWRLADVLVATGGVCVSAPADMAFRAVTTDSRAAQPGDLFVALVGERFDGHDFITDAVRRGAAGVIVSRLPARDLPVQVVRVPCTLTALGDLAAYRRRLLPDLKVVAITGSCGKTTVKEMCAAILARRYPLLKTRGNFNNLVGLPLSLLPVCRHHRVAVLEMGMNQPGEIARLTAIAAPDVACITNVMAAHVGGLGGIAGVAAAKEELFAAAPARAVLAVNLDDPRVRRMAARCANPQVTFGRRPEAMVRGLWPRRVGLCGMGFTLEIAGQRRRVRLPAFGGHVLADALAAAALAYALGQDIDDIAAGLAAFEPPAMRMRVVETAGVRLVDDTYNANPGSVGAALKAVAGLRQRKRERLVAVLGDMFELGDASEVLHAEVGRMAAGSGCDLLVAVGRFAPVMAAAARSAGVEKATVCQDRESAAELLRTLVAAGEIRSGDWILLKGSRGMRMEVVRDALAAALEQRERGTAPDAGGDG